MEMFFFLKEKQIISISDTTGLNSTWTNISWLEKWELIRDIFAGHSSPVNGIGKISHWRFKWCSEEPKSLIYLGKQPSAYSDFCLVRILTQQTYF